MKTPSPENVVHLEGRKEKKERKGGKEWGGENIKTWSNFDQAIHILFKTF